MFRHCTETLVTKSLVTNLEEATSALDAESEYLIQKALHRCSEGRTVIIIAHRLSTVKKADRILVIDEGRLIESGSHDELMQLPEGMYRSLVRRQLRDSESEENGENGVTENGVTESDHQLILLAFIELLKLNVL